MSEFIKYPKIKLIGDEETEDLLKNPNDEIIIEEKMDGSNTRWMIKDNSIIFGSRNCILEEDSPNAKNWKKSIDFIKKNVKPSKELEGYIFFGETMIRHSMDYDWNKIPCILGFDIYDMRKNKYLNYDEKVKMFKKLNIPIVPLIKKVKAKDIKKVSDDDVPISEYPGIDRQAEGIVFKNYKTQTFAKYVREKFREINRDTFGRAKKYSKNDNELLVNTYCTNARIDKNLFKLVDEGNKINMKLMKLLPSKVYEDIWEENWKEIIFKNWRIDFKKARSLIAKRCLAVLKQVIVNNELLG